VFAIFLRKILFRVWHFTFCGTQNKCVFLAFFHLGFGITFSGKPGSTAPNLRISAPEKNGLK